MLFWSLLFLSPLAAAGSCDRPSGGQLYPVAWVYDGDSLRLDIDPKTHPAWTGVHRLIDSGGQLAKFNKRFSGIGLKK